MISKESSSELIELKTRLHQVVAENKISSLRMICDIVGAEEEQARLVIEELVEEGVLEGTFTADGQRFFLTDVKVSQAPVAPTKDTGYVKERADTQRGKLVFVTGIVMMIGGTIVRGLNAWSEMLGNAGVAIFLLGFVVLVGGWLMITKTDPPSNLK